MLAESTIERACCAKAKIYGVLNIKLYQLPGWPDRMFYKDGAVLFVEFKAPGAKPRLLQLHIHRILRKHKFRVEVIDNVEDFLKVLKEHYAL